MSGQMKKVKAYYFSPTGTTESVIRKLATDLSLKMQCVEAPDFVDFTPLNARQEKQPILVKDSLLILGVPVYAGRVPNILLNYLGQFKSENSDVILVAVYGNRAFDDALEELRSIFAENGFRILGAGAFVGAHAFSNKIATGRPDDKDFNMIESFAAAMANRLSNTLLSPYIHPFEIPGEVPFRPYYRPLDVDGNPFDFKAIKPMTLATCIHCGLCADKCPVQSISHEDHQTLIGKCIKCCSCVKRCPVNAKRFDDSNFIKHKRELEVQCVDRQESKFFI